MALGVGAASAALCAPVVASASSGRRVFEIFRAGDRIGRHSVSASKSGDELQVAIDIEIEVRVLGFRAYSYAHTNRETWLRGQFAGLASRTDDDGERFSLTVRREGDRLFRSVDGPDGRTSDSFGQRAPTSYWNYGNFGHDWFSTQTGKPMALRFSDSRSAGLTRWDLAGDFTGTLYYDEAREWRGMEFPARGEQIVYRQVQDGGRLLALV